MTARIVTPIGKAVVKNGVWNSDNKDLEKFLQRVESEEYIEYYPNPDLGSALRAVKALPESKVVSYTKMKYDPDVVY